MYGKTHHNIVMNLQLKYINQLQQQQQHIDRRSHLKGEPFTQMCQCHHLGGESGKKHLLHSHGRPRGRGQAQTPQPQLSLIWRVRSRANSGQGSLYQEVACV